MFKTGEKRDDKAGAVSFKLNNKAGPQLPFLTQKQKFENFLTYRKRLSRLASVQGIHFYEQFKLFNEEDFTVEGEINEVYRVIIFFYKKYFFPEKYGDSKKTKRLDEKFVRTILGKTITNIDLIDSYIKKRLKKGWNIKRLNSVVRAGLRVAVSEILFTGKPNLKIIASEYTDIISFSIVDLKEVAFFNAVLDNIIKDISANLLLK